MHFTGSLSLSHCQWRRVLQSVDEMEAPTNDVFFATAFWFLSELATMEWGGFQARHNEVPCPGTNISQAFRDLAFTPWLHPIRNLWDRRLVYCPRLVLAAISRFTMKEEEQPDSLADSLNSIAQYRPQMYFQQWLGEKRISLWVTSQICQFWD